MLLHNFMVIYALCFPDQLAKVEPKVLLACPTDQGHLSWLMYFGVCFLKSEIGRLFKLDRVIWRIIEVDYTVEEIFDAAGEQKLSLHNSAGQGRRWIGEAARASSTCWDRKVGQHGDSWKFVPLIGVFMECELGRYIDIVYGLVCSLKKKRKKR